jgi:hypothetical protein
MMEAICTSGTSANFYKTARHNISKDTRLHISRRENLKCHSKELSGNFMISSAIITFSTRTLHQRNSIFMKCTCSGTIFMLGFFFSGTFYLQLIVTAGTYATFVMISVEDEVRASA